MSITLIRKVLNSPKVPRADTTLAVCVASFADESAEDQTCFAGISLLAKMSKRGERSTIDALHRLRKTGLFKIDSAAGPNGTNIYRFNPAFFEDPANPARESARESARGKLPRISAPDLHPINKDQSNINKGSIKQTSSDFEERFWGSYGIKEGRKKCAQVWGRLPEKTKRLIDAHLTKYVTATPDLDFRKLPLTYLRGETWLDEDLPRPRTGPKTTAKYVNGASIMTYTKTITQ